MRRVLCTRRMRQIHAADQSSSRSQTKWASIIRRL